MADNTETSTPRPDWLTIEFLQNILREHHKNAGLSVRAFEVKPAVGKGENYGSVLLRVRVQHTTNNGKTDTPLIIKMKLMDDFQAAAVIEEMNSFSIESDAYLVLLPKVYELLKSIGDETILAPKCLAADKTKGFLIFEDSIATGFAMIDRRDAMNVEHLRVALDRLAKWHAATMCILETDKTMGQKFMPAQFDVSSMPWRLVIENQIQTLIEYTARYPHLSHLGPKLTRQLSTVYERVCAKAAQADDGFQVLCHGDLWSNNILFRRDQRDNYVDVRLLDFQQVCNGSLCIDLCMLLHGGSNENLTAADWDDLLQHYYGIFKTTMRKLCFAEQRIPSLTALHMRMLEFTICEAYTSLLMIGGRSLEKTSEVDPVAHYLQDEPESRQFRLEAFLNPRCTKYLHFLLNFYERKGVFD